ncbi:lanthionine synthetase C family protein [Actinokineospora cianjurensis]|uniref:Lanthionine synthetase-like protein n=1 Tax=Actinokineospora cianjurensis TaxID=585224 RepID=A0A421BC41_9PSEU|nr:lanthionine synthetase C family protein [Actinokineospora cianjurensis]RLK61907.1 lanthionine synthetase-like protein [Actinokineospora cianjurensis]
MTPTDSLADGAAGIALLHFERARTGACATIDAHPWAVTMTKGPVTAHPDVASLYRGAPAVAFALLTAGHPAYAAAVADLDEHIVTLTRERLERAHRRIDNSLLPDIREFDLISGLTGIGTYLLHRGHHLLTEVLAYLVRLTEPLGELPGWWCGPPTDGLAEEWIGGHGNLGLAHGIAGPLALLAMAMRRGLVVDGQVEAISTIWRWFDDWRVGTGREAWWPGRITGAELVTGTVTQAGPQRPSWCYGTPGQARALQLAALALGDTRRQQQVENTLAGCVTDPSQLGLLVDTTLCHGWAGVVLTTWRAAADAGPDSELAAHLPRLRELLDHHLQTSTTPGHGLLEGEAGQQLTCLAIDTDQPVRTTWDLCLLVSG